LFCFFLKFSFKERDRGQRPFGAAPSTIFLFSRTFLIFI
jgi:hypothetical protein